MNANHTMAKETLRFAVRQAVPGSPNNGRTAPNLKQKSKPVRARHPNMLTGLCSPRGGPPSSPLWQHRARSASPSPAPPEKELSPPG